MPWLAADPAPRPEAPSPSALRFLGKAFFSFSPALETHGAQKRAKAHSPRPFQAHARVSFMVSGFQPVLAAVGCRRGASPREKTKRPEPPFQEASG